MDGLTAIEELSGLCQQTQFIILSGYSDFAYAQKAIQLGARDYLLKPPSLDDIRKIFMQAEKDRDQKTYRDNQAFFMNPWHSLIPTVSFQNWIRILPEIYLPICFVWIIKNRKPETILQRTI